MLVDIVMKPGRDLLFEAIDGIDYKNYERPRTGIYIGGFNFDHKISNRVECYPNFNSVAFNQMGINMILYEKTEEDLDDHAKKMLNGYRTAPDIEPFYIRKNWKKFKEDDYDIVTDLHPYGVCDSYEQLLSLYDFEKDPRKLCINITAIRKDEQSKIGGWRWHKWGPYVGLQTPTTEYLYDEPKIESVFAFHIYQILD